MDGVVGADQEIRADRFQLAMPICRGVMTMSGVLTISVELPDYCTPQRTAANGASCPLPRVAAKVPSLSPQRPFAVSNRTGAIIHHLDRCLSISQSMPAVYNSDV
jgi:hypothetical protein